MTENSAFFGARRGVGPPDSGPQTAAVRRACQRRQIEPDWDGNGGHLGNAIGTEGFQKSGGQNAPEEPFARTIDVATSAPFASNDDPSAVKGCPTKKGATCSS